MQNGSRILVVDDDPNMLLLIQYHLEKRGHAVTTAASGEVGLSLALQNPFELLVLDLMVPGPSGIEICRRLREEPRYADTPILLVTARCRLTDFDDAADARVTDYVTKPFDPIRLADQIEERLRASTP